MARNSETNKVMKVTLAQIAEFVTKTRYEDIPNEVLEFGKLLLLDNVGVGILGASHPKSELVTRIAQQFSSGPETGLFSKNLKCSANMSTFANSCFCQIYDFNDGHRMAARFGGTPHPGRTVIPITLAEAELNSVTGKELLSALVIGYEIAIKLRKDKDKTGISIGPLLAATAISSRLRGYTGKQTRTALSIASAAYVNQARLKTIPSYLRHGFVARTGIESATLAGCGMKRPKVPDELHISRNFSELGDQNGFEIDNVYLKLYPSCRMTHSALDALFEIRQQNHFNFEEVDKITVQQINQGMYVAKRRPTAAPGFSAAQLNLYYCLASALVHGGLSVQAFAEESLQDQRIHSLYERIEVIADSELSHQYPVQGRPAIVNVKLKNGSTWTASTDVARGDPTRPLTKTEILQKFYTNSGILFPYEKACEISETVFNLEKFDNLSGLFDKLA